MRRGVRVTVLEVILVILVVGILAFMLLPLLARAREEVNPIRCRFHLQRLARGLATYVSAHGDGRFYPWPVGRGRKPDQFSGAEWLASLYWTNVLADSLVLTCPESSDECETKDHARDVGRERASATFGPRTVSYAGLHSGSFRDAAGRPRAVTVDDARPDEPMASDDTEGPINHGEANNGMMLILFFDGHIEHRINDQIDLERAVGHKGGLLEKLRN